MVDGRTPFQQKSFKHIGTKLVQNLNDKQLSAYHEKKNVVNQQNIQNELYNTADRAIAKPHKKSPVDSPSHYSKQGDTSKFSVGKSFASRNPISNRLSRQTYDNVGSAANASEMDDRYKVKIRSSIRSKTNRNQNKLKS